MAQKSIPKALEAIIADVEALPDKAGDIDLKAHKIQTANQIRNALNSARILEKLIS